MAEKLGSYRRRCLSGASTEVADPGRRLRSSRRLCARVVTTRFGAIAARLHVAPTAELITARVYEEPAATFSRTFAHPSPPLGDEEVSRRTGDRPDDTIKLLVLPGPAPDKTARGLRDACARHGFRQNGVQGFEFRLSGPA